MEERTEETLRELVSTMRRSAARRSGAPARAELVESFGKARVALASAAREITALRERVTPPRRSLRD